MKKYKSLNIKGVMLDKWQLENYMEKLASDNILQDSSNKETYPIPKMLENFKEITVVYNMLNEHIKLGIPIHPAGEWLLDNFYVIEETVQMVEKQMPMNKYIKFLGISNGTYKGYARIYVLASEIIAYTDNKIDANIIKDLLSAYQKKKSLSMDEIWNIGLFFQIALIQNIRDICEKIYFSQMQKYKVENIIERLVENKENLKYKNIGDYSKRVKGYGEMKYPFIEYMSYRLKKYGKKAYSFINILEEQVNKMGTNIEDVIRKEHFDIAVKKVSMANSITSIKELLRIDFVSIFQNINGVEEILKKDPANIYNKMDNKTKEYYRNRIKEISSKIKISEIYIVNKIIELCSRENLNEKQKHVGFYLIDDGQDELLYSLTGNSKKSISKSKKSKIYVFSIWMISIIIDLILSISIYFKTNILICLLFFIISILPIGELVSQIIKYILGKVVKTKLIPKLDFESSGVPIEYSTFVVIPTILKDRQKVKELMKKLEIYYLANKSENIYFTLLGDCSSGPNKEEKFDNEVIDEGLKQIKNLNEKYSKKNEIPKFSFIYRKRFWNGKEECYLGWERKRGLLNQFNEYILGNDKDVFRVNSLEEWKKENSINEFPVKIKYIITLDADTELVLNTGLNLIGAMAHILNKPELEENDRVVVKGHGLIQPRVGINLNNSRKNLFTNIFAGNGGTDPYTNAISDIYQDNFEEGIFTGKGIYDLEVFSNIFKNEIPEDLILSHDLLEGSYLRCGLATDIILMDGYPSSYISSKTRQHRWIRGDFQICNWLHSYIIDKKQNKTKNPLNFLSRYKILDNIIRAILPITLVILYFFLLLINMIYKANIILPLTIILIITSISTIIDIINTVIFNLKDKKYQKSFEPTINSICSSILRGIIAIVTLPDKAYNSLDAMVRSIYRMKVSNKHLLEWTTSEDVEKQNKNSLKIYYISMISNVILGILSLIYSILYTNIFTLVISILWLIAPTFMCYISKSKKEVNLINELNEKEKDYLLKLGNDTWQFFKDNINEENNFLPPDNYQEGRKPIVTPRTSCTNIGLGLLAVVSSYDLGYENLEDTLVLLSKMLETIEALPKWYGHLYNWYDTKTLEPLNPRYISTVDSGNFISYVYVLKQFYIEVRNKIIIQIDDENEKEKLLKLIPEWIDKPIEEINIANADFTKLYDSEKRLFSIGFNIEDNKLTDSYYDLLASEARGASFVAIAKKDITSKHWYNLNRTLTTLNGYKGLVSWSGTAFEYLMPNINMKKYKGSLIDESIKFMIDNQQEYAKRLEIPWGFSETAFNVKDLNGNYQYKAIGIPWLGLKRGLEDDIVVASYASALALTESPKEATKNLIELQKYNMYGKYGLYESLDFTPVRLSKGKRYESVKTYMAHHQGLILLSINNLFKERVLVKRFHSNPEIEALDILLQEKMPEDMIITNEEKTKPEKIKYIDYESNAKRIYTKIDEKLNHINAISNGKYLVVTNQKGEGYSKFNDVLINRFKETSDETQGIQFYFKNIKNKRIWTSNYSNYLSKPDKYEINFSEDSYKIKRIDGGIETITKAAVDCEEPIEIRNICIKNNGIEDEVIEVTSAFEPVLSRAMQDYAHPVFNNLFLSFEFEDNIMLVKRRKHSENEQELYMAVSFFTQAETLGDLEYEIDKEKFLGRGNLGLPIAVEYSKPFSKNTNLVIDPIIALRQTVKIKPNENVNLSLVIVVGHTKQEVLEKAKKYSSFEIVKKCFDLSKARVEAEARYLSINHEQIETYQDLLGYILYQNPFKKLYIKDNIKENFAQSDLWKYGISGDLPILLVKIKNISDVEVLDEVLKAYEFYKSKNIQIDIVILDEEENNYEKYVKEKIVNSILNKNLSYMQNINGGIFIINETDDKKLLEFRANVIIDATKGDIKQNLKEMEEEYLDNIKEIGYEQFSQVPVQENIIKQLDVENLKYFNEYGGFSSDGKEYKIRVNKENKLPTVWSHIISNNKFGTLVTESLGGYTWSKNSRLNRLSSWSNNQITDIPSEIIYMQEKETGKTWSLGLNPMPDDNDYLVTYGFGYAKYEHISMNIYQKLDVFVAKDEEIKINLLNLKNLSSAKKKIKFVYYIKPVLGEDELFTNGYLKIDYKQNTNTILVENKANNISKNKQYMFISSSEKITSYTGDRKSFIGNGSISNPEGIKKVSLNNENSFGIDTRIAIQIDLELEAFEEKNISFVMGVGDSKVGSLDISYKYTKIYNCQDELDNVKKYWNNLLGNIQVNTPVESFNILLNGWLAYQTIASRLLGRSGFYQSGGAFGFRDQLQDTLGLKFYDTNFMKEQILKHSRHQFIDGDVEHWWHDDTNRGVRTRFSDDLLWLVFVTIEYIETTGDYSILDIEVPYLEGQKLEDFVDEKYDLYKESNIKESIFKHCIRAIEKSLNFGNHNLPKMGSGDWNDSMNKVGQKGKGESIWLGFFQYDILNRWINIMEYKNEHELLIERYKQILEQLKKALNTSGWDGRWYKRAYTDEGYELGSLQNEECRIDGISQSWSVISNAGDNDKKFISMESLENHLIDRKNGIIKLLDPPFEKSKLEPGYIKSYIPGTRENGGQYTHECCC